MSNYLNIIVLGLNKAFDKQALGIVPKNPEFYDSVFYCLATEDDAAIFGEQFVPGSLWIYAKGQLHLGSSDVTKQDKLTAGSGIIISEDNVISSSAAVNNLDINVYKDTELVEIPDYFTSTDQYHLNGFYIIPQAETLDELYDWATAHDSRQVTVNISNAAAKVITGGVWGEIENGLLMVTNHSMNLVESEQEQIIAYTDFTVSGYVMSCYTGIFYNLDEESQSFDFTFDYTPMCPLLINATLQDDDTYNTERDESQDIAYWKKYIENGGRQAIVTLYNTNGKKIGERRFDLTIADSINGSVALLVGQHTSLDENVLEFWSLVVASSGTAMYFKFDGMLKPYEVSIIPNITSTGGSYQLLHDTRAISGSTIKSQLKLQLVVFGTLLDSGEFVQSLAFSVAEDTELNSNKFALIYRQVDKDDDGLYDIIDTYYVFDSAGKISFTIDESGTKTFTSGYINTIRTKASENVVEEISNSSSVTVSTDASGNKSLEVNTLDNDEVEDVFNEVF